MADRSYETVKFLLVILMKSKEKINYELHKSKQNQIHSKRKAKRLMFNRIFQY